MFDITSYVREKIFRRPQLTKHLAGEELTEKQTTKMGYFLLYCMFFAILGSAQWTLSIIRDIPTAPVGVPVCVENVIDTFGIKHDAYARRGYTYNYGEVVNYYRSPDEYECQLTASNPSFDFTTEYAGLKSPYTDILASLEAIRKLEDEKRSLEYTQQNTQKDYDTALTEKIADEKNQVYDPEDVKSDLRTSRAEISTLTSQIRVHQNAIKSLQSKYASSAQKLKQKADAIDEEYRTAYLVYRLYVALLSFIFAIIVFTILYRMYVKRKIQNSPHTIIFSVATFAYGLVILQISCLFIWDIIPRTLFELIQKFLSNFTPLLYLVQFLWPLIIIAIFWYLVYRIQRRLYSPKNILKRFVADKKCPHCGNGVDITKPFCPLCAHEIQVRCQKCHEFTLKWMPHCANCGTVNIEENPPL